MLQILTPRSDLIKLPGKHLEVALATCRLQGRQSRLGTGPALPGALLQSLQLCSARRAVQDRALALQRPQLLLQFPPGLLRLPELSCPHRLLGSAGVHDLLLRLLMLGQLGPGLELDLPKVREPPVPMSQGLRVQHLLLFPRQQYQGLALGETVSRLRLTSRHRLVRHAQLPSHRQILGLGACQVLLASLVHSHRGVVPLPQLHAGLSPALRGAEHRRELEARVAGLLVEFGLLLLPSRPRQAHLRLQGDQLLAQCAQVLP
mmetsp:Transcript_115555/g.367392  ORF Transcript_115555/g.367392 Transcript_115555/m.367392 type:complete len:261 (-) Transcript_115555:1986-2768(-)